ncbi:DUF742 domain-containing protein [Saccharopolyspora sp. HNM0983]|uniref:DUF742 domain-containing protein n=1 Tax=Saccharopolyspora montiporae TaxID=2781240 RepID=A0A929G0W5_9PSEU|nr:DUF742 domain-containing protein [Saccharopolyspora sp. HNM0983]MBE9374048.1 DUF742 domain-containing protein [Saccharopolyspora sp. HNM0983]
MSTGSGSEWDGDLFRLYNKRLGADSWQDDFAGADSAGGRAQDPSGGSDGGYDRALFGGPGADLFGSGYYEAAAEDPGEQQRSRQDSGSGPPSVSMPSISQPMSAISQSMPSISGSMPAIPGGEEEEAPEGYDSGSLVRPYARTRGRTRTDYDLAIETLVTTSERGRTQATQARQEHRSISELCLEARSVAEVAAHLRLPLGVVRVLIGDMAGDGLVLIHDSGMVVGDRPSMEFLERVLSGLRRL